MTQIDRMLFASIHYAFFEELDRIDISPKLKNRDPYYIVNDVKFTYQETTNGILIESMDFPSTKVTVSECFCRKRSEVDILNDLTGDTESIILEPTANSGIMILHPETIIHVSLLGSIDGGVSCTKLTYAGDFIKPILSSEVPLRGGTKSVLAAMINEYFPNDKTIHSVSKISSVHTNNQSQILTGTYDKEVLRFFVRGYGNRQYGIILTTAGRLIECCVERLTGSKLVLTNCASGKKMIIEYSGNSYIVNPTTSDRKEFVISTGCVEFSWMAK